MGFAIRRDDGEMDAFTKQIFASYDDAYEELERYYRNFCCSDDERVEYSIVKLDEKIDGIGSIYS